MTPFSITRWAPWPTTSTRSSGAWGPWSPTEWRQATPRGTYGRATDALTSLADAPLRWEPEFSLGVLSNDNAFLLGYVQEVRAFCESVLTNTPPNRAGLRDARQMMRIYEAFHERAGRMIELAD